MRQTSNPSLVKTSANPSPIPSVAPVITAQHSPDEFSELLYFLRMSFKGISYRATFQMTETINFINLNRSEYAITCQTNYVGLRDKMYSKTIHILCK
jgi:hypothetical protein